MASRGLLRRGIQFVKRIATMVEDGKVTCIAHGPDAIDQKIEALGKEWYFDFDVMFGPLWTGKRGKELANQNVPKAVWDAFEVWLTNWKTQQV
jgi:hypothetical protein